MVDVAFSGVSSRIAGAGFAHLEFDQIQLARTARLKRKPVVAGGLLKYVHGGEYHAYNPDVVMSL